MDLRPGLIRSRLAADEGSITAEAAVGLAALVGIAALMLKVLGVLLVFLQLQATANHASQIASASGDLGIRLAQAKAFIREQAPRAQSSVSGGAGGVEIEVYQSEGLEVLGWQPVLRVRVTALLLDQAVW